MMLKIAIIGCGKIADDHVSVIQGIESCEICGVCDREELMSRQLAQRLGGVKTFSKSSELLSSCRPDVVHITTPPQSHFNLACECLEAGSHVLVEKPFTITALENEEVLRLALSKGLKFTVGHNHQLSPVAIRMRERIKKGVLGGDPVHMESIFCYAFAQGPYGKALLGDKNHWVRRLPGGLFHNVISHGICKIAEFIGDDNPKVVAVGSISNELHRLGEREIIDELRVTICGANGSTAYFTFSSQIKPARHEFRVFGPRNYCLADHTHQMLIVGPVRNYKSYLNYFLPPMLLGWQCVRNGLCNIFQFMKNDFHMDYGRRKLFRQFYRAIREGTPVPIPYKEILITARIMDGIIAQTRGKHFD